jgi:FMN phosphatase YigB (HAD superfamily)
VIDAIIFDLDNCLAPADEVGPALLEPMFTAIRHANHGTLPHEVLERAFADCWRLPLDAVAAKYGFSGEMLEAGWAAGKTIAVKAPMSGYPDLAALNGLPSALFLVTSGFRILQESKIDALGLRATMTETHVDAIDEPHRSGKSGIFRDILERHGFDPRGVLVVGDNPESEIAAGNRLGMVTVQILRPGIDRGTTARHYIADLSELHRLLRDA